MIAGFDPIDLELLGDAELSYHQATVESDISHALVTDRPGRISFAFRGTSDATDVLTDVMAAESITLPGIPGKIDEAFWRSLCSIAWRLVPMALDAQAAGKQILVTGHSLGGAEAQDFALMLVLIGIRPARLSVWEPARALGTEALALIADVPGIATWLGDDEIPELPPWLGQRPIARLGHEHFTVDPLGDHRLATVRAAVTAATV